jgi:hypothetical protein
MPPCPPRIQPVLQRAAARPLRVERGVPPIGVSGQPLIRHRPPRTITLPSGRLAAAAGLDALGGTVTAPAWRDKPSWYLVATDDRMIPPDAQRSMAEGAGASLVEVPGSQAITSLGPSPSPTSSDNPTPCSPDSSSCQRHRIPSSPGPASRRCGRIARTTRRSLDRPVRVSRESGWCWSQVSGMAGCAGVGHPGRRTRRGDRVGASRTVERRTHDAGAAPVPAADEPVTRPGRHPD